MKLLLPGLIGAFLGLTVALTPLISTSGGLQTPFIGGDLMSFFHKKPKFHVMDIGEAWKFCGRFPDAVMCTAHPGNAMGIEDIVRTDSALRAQYHYVDDIVQYKVQDYWSNQGVSGDCEDYALTLAERLAAAGLDGKDMFLALWVLKSGGMHATLIVETKDAGEVEIGVGPFEGPAPSSMKDKKLMALVYLDGSKNMAVTKGVKMVRTPDDALLVYTE